MSVCQIVKGKLTEGLWGTPTGQDEPGSRSHHSLHATNRLPILIRFLSAKQERVWNTGMAPHFIIFMQPFCMLSGLMVHVILSLDIAESSVAKQEEYRRRLAPKEVGVHHHTTHTVLLKSKISCGKTSERRLVVRLGWTRENPEGDGSLYLVQPRQTGCKKNRTAWMTPVEGQCTDEYLPVMDN